MPALLLELPFLFLKFWFFEAPVSLISYFYIFNKSAVRFLSLGLMIRTFFKPIKNEYREGLVGFSVAMGMGLKSILIFLDVLIFILLLLFEISFIILFLALPFLIFSLVLPQSFNPLSFYEKLY